MKKRNHRKFKPRAARLTASACRPVIDLLEDRRLMSTTVPAYLVPTAPGVEIKPILTVGDSAPNGYRMAGIPDGLGAFDNGDGTFTVLMNHEIRNTAGAVRAHGAKGAFVSKWVFDKKTGATISGGDLIQQVFQYNPGTASYAAATRAFNRFCSATLAEQTAFFNPANGLGTTERIFTNGEEDAATGTAWAHVVTGPSAGQSYELAGLGNFAFENAAPSPFPQDLTIVGAQDDSSRFFSSEGAGVGAAENPSEVYFYVGTKKSTGSVVDKAGLTGGILNGLKVGSAVNESQVTSGDRFSLASLGDVSGMDAAQLEAASIAAGATQFRRPEDGSWDPTNRNVYYFVTTDQFSTTAANPASVPPNAGGGTTRLWKLTFDDITHPELGGKIEIAQDSTPAKPGEMFDNVTVNYNGDVLVQEDVGNNAYLGGIFQHDASTGDLIRVAQHDPRFFLDTDPASPGVQPSEDADPYQPGKQGTQDEESSGIIDVSGILGKGYYLTVVQAHFTSTPEFVEGGQLLLINTNAAKASVSNGVLSVTGTVNDDSLAVTRQGKAVSVSFNGKTLGSFSEKAIDSIALDGTAGSDVLSVDNDVQSPALISGGLGDDALLAGGGESVLIGGAGRDLLSGGPKDNVLIGGSVALEPSVLQLVLDSWSGKGSYDSRVGKLRAVFADKVIDDGATDFLIGAGGRDWFLTGTGDVAVDAKNNESVN